MTVSSEDFLKLKQEVHILRTQLQDLLSAMPDTTDLKTVAAQLEQKPATIRAFIRRNTSELGIGTIFKDDEFEIENAIMLVRKSAVMKLRKHYGKI